MDKLVLGSSGQPKVFGKSRALGEVNVLVTIREFNVPHSNVGHTRLMLGVDGSFREHDWHLGAAL